MGTLEDRYYEALDANEEFEHKAILFIGGNKYDAATITVLQGLKHLGWTINVLSTNINSWFCETLIDSPSDVSYDFVISNLGWGVRWGFYDQYNLHSKLKVLIDGEDDRGRFSWQNKHEEYLSTYVYEPDEAIKRCTMSSPYRWVERVGQYRPDVVFTSQRCLGTYYLPFGIQDEYNKMYLGLAWQNRELDFAHFDGPGIYRGEMSEFFRIHKYDNMHNGYAYGGDIEPSSLIAEYIKKDIGNVHEWHRWRCPKEYFRILNHTKIALYPGCTQWYWESKRQYEILASGCLFLMRDPGRDTRQYPIQELWPYGFYKNMEELKHKLTYIHRLLYPQYEETRETIYHKAQKYFTSIPIARYFLMGVINGTHLCTRAW